MRREEGQLREKEPKVQLLTGSIKNRTPNLPIRPFRAKVSVNRKIQTIITVMILSRYQQVEDQDADTKTVSQATNGLSLRRNIDMHFLVLRIDH